MGNSRKRTYVLLNQTKHVHAIGLERADRIRLVPVALAAIANGPSLTSVYFEPSFCWANQGWPIRRGKGALALGLRERGPRPRFLYILNRFILVLRL
jgi:hypothetical protein